MTTAASPGLHALVLADGDRPTRRGLDRAWPGWSDGAQYVVAADGGVRLAAALGLRIDAWVGDGDSVEASDLEELRAAGVPVELASPDKDESDTELAVLAALRHGAAEVTILGGLGGRRFDHALANVFLLTHPALLGRTLRLIDDRTRITVLAAPAAHREGAGASTTDTPGAPVRVEIAGRPGDVVSLLPLGGGVDGVTTQGLRYPLRDERLEAGPARGLSNLRTGTAATVTIRRGRLLIVESPATLSP